MKQIIPFSVHLILAIFTLSLAADETIAEMSVNSVDFLKDFKAGILGTGVDCENIKFLPNGKFVYKFTGDCKGWGRILNGSWKKEGNQLKLAANLREDKAEGETGCAGSYYHENTPKEKHVCYSKYKKDILQKFGVFPALFRVTGTVSITPKLTVSVKIESYLTNNKKKGKIKGLMHFEDEKFGVFRSLDSE